MYVKLIQKSTFLVRFAVAPFAQDGCRSGTRIFLKVRSVWYRFLGSDVYEDIFTHFSSSLGDYNAPLEC